MALSLLDVLGYRDEIPIGVAYEVDGERTTEFPVSARLDGARPVWETLPGWRCDISSARSFSELPRNAQAYVERIEELIGVPVRWISIGPRREAMIAR